MSETPRHGLLKLAGTLLVYAAIIAVATSWQARRLPAIHFQGQWCFSDPDDSMRLVRVREILQGRGPIVRQIAELGWPAGATLHWTTPMDYMVLGTVRVWSVFSRSTDTLEAGGAWTPVLIGAAYLSLVFGLMKRSLGWGPALIGTAYVTFSRAFSHTFQLGHCDHHCMIEICQWVAVAALWPKRIRGDEGPEPTLAGVIVSGMSMGLAIWVAVQAMVIWGAILAGLTLATYCSAIEQRRIWISRQRLWNLTVLAVLVAAWLIEQWPSLLRPEPDKVSLLHVLLGVLALAVPAGRVSQAQGVITRFAAFAAALIAFALWFFAHRGEMNDAFRPTEFRRWYGFISEFQPLVLYAGGEWSILPVVRTLGYLPLALPFLLVVFLRSEQLNLAAKATLAILAPVMTAFSLFYFRWIDHFNAAVMPVTVIALFEIARRLSAHVSAADSVGRRIAVGAMAALAIGILTYPAIQSTLAIPTNSPSPVAMRGNFAADVINQYERQFPSVGDRRGVMAGQAIGPTLLLRTGLPIVAGPYHRAMDGQLESARFFAERDPQAAKRQLERLRVRYVVTVGDPLFNLRIMECIAFGEPKSYDASQYKIIDGEVREGVSPRPESAQTMAMRLHEIRGFEEVGLRPVSTASENGPNGPQTVGFVYVLGGDAPK